MEVEVRIKEVKLTLRGIGNSRDRQESSNYRGVRITEVRIIEVPLYILRNMPMCQLESKSNEKNLSSFFPYTPRDVPRISIMCFHRVGFATELNGNYCNRQQKLVEWLQNVGK